MKKLITVLLATVMTVSLSACGGGINTAGTGNTDAENETVQSGEARETSSAQPSAAQETSSGQSAEAQETSSVQPAETRGTSSAQPSKARETSSAQPAEAQETSSAQLARGRGTSSAQPSEAGGTAGNKILVAYFSATGNTEDIAQKLAGGLGADLYEITPEDPYTNEDLNYSDSSARAAREQNDPEVRPAISGSVQNLEQYGTVLLGYPIWWGKAPRIMSTFIESYDFSGKTLACFCTSGSSGFGSSDSALREAVPSANWLDGRRFSAGASAEEVLEWADGLGTGQGENEREEENAVMKMKIGDTSVTVNWENNESVEALRALCADHPLEISMSMYGGFEQVGSLGQSLPRSDSQTTTTAGDIVLYSSDQIVVFYGSNTWSYTRLGRITDKTEDEMANLLSGGDVTITITAGDRE